jgi:hypothetical protein
MLIFFIIGLKRGFTRSLFNLLGMVAAIAISLFLSSWLAEFLYTGFIKDSIIQNIQASIAKGDTDAIAKVLYILSLVPSYMADVLSSFGFNAGNLTSLFSLAPQKSTEIIVQIISPLIIAFLKVIVFVLLFIILKILISMLSKFAGHITNIPLLHQVDIILGGAIAIVQCILALFVIMAILQAAAKINAYSIPAVLDEAIKTSYIFSFLYNLNPIAHIFLLNN